MTFANSVSLLIPVYNCRKYIQRCWDSASAQTLENLEILFIDDGSTDGSSDLLAAAIRENSSCHSVKLICHERNRGVAAARNTALAHASGEYVFFVDADDWLDHETLQELYVAARQSKADIVGCDQILHFASSDQLVRSPLHNTGAENVCALFENKMVGGLSHVLVRRELFNKAGASFIEGADYAEDMQAKVKLFFATDSYAYLPKPFYHYDQMNPGSVSHRESMKKIRGRYLNVRSMIDTLNAHYDPGFAVHIRRLKAEARLHMARLYYEFHQADCNPADLFPEASSWRDILQYRASRRYKLMLILLKLHCGWGNRIVWSRTGN